MNATPKFAVAALAALLVASDAHAMRWYSPSTGRWFSRNPIGERGGANVYGFVRNTPVAAIDPLGLAESTCEKCGVKNLNLTIVGVAFTENSYLIHLVGQVTYKTRADGLQYRGYCCAIRQFVKSRVTYNGQPQPTAGSGVPLDGQ